MEFCDDVLKGKVSRSFKLAFKWFRKKVYVDFFLKRANAAEGNNECKQVKGRWVLLLKIIGLKSVQNKLLVGEGRG